MIVRQFAVHLPGVIHKAITDRMHTMAVQGLQEAGLHMLDMMADRSPTLAIDVLRYITNNNIALSGGTTEWHTAWLSIQLSRSYRWRLMASAGYIGVSV